MTQISKRLSVERDGDGFSFVLADVGDTGDGTDCSHITRDEADALIIALAPEGFLRVELERRFSGIVRGVIDEQGRIVAPPQPALPTRPPGPHQSNHDARQPLNDTGE